MLCGVIGADMEGLSLREEDDGITMKATQDQVFPEKLAFARLGGSY